jgi:hypothetical protein
MSDHTAKGGTEGHTTPATPPATTPRGPDKRQPKSSDRRQTVVNNRHLQTGLERRRGPGRRRSDFIKAAEEGEMTKEQFLFVMAIDAYKRVNQKPFPTWTEVLEVIRKLGYRKTAPMTLDLTSAEDWNEPADAPAFAPKVDDKPIESAVSAIKDED